MRSAAVRGELTASLRKDSSGLALVAANAEDNRVAAFDELRRRSDCGELKELDPSKPMLAVMLAFMLATDLRRDADTITTSEMDCGMRDEEASDMDGEIGRPVDCAEESCSTSGVDVCATSPLVYCDTRKTNLSLLAP